MNSPDSFEAKKDPGIIPYVAANELEKIGDIYLICGGDLKGQEIASKELQEIKSLKKVFIFGKDKEFIFDTFSKLNPIIRVFNPIFFISYIRPSSYI